MNKKTNLKTKMKVDNLNILKLLGIPITPQPTDSHPCPRVGWSRSLSGWSRRHDVHISLICGALASNKVRLGHWPALADEVLVCAAHGRWSLPGTADCSKWPPTPAPGV